MCGTSYLSSRMVVTSKLPLIESAECDDGTRLTEDHGKKMETHIWIKFHDVIAYHAYVEHCALLLL